MDPFLGEIRLLPFSFAPRGWALCNGQTLSIAQNTALYALLGVQYGGDGRTTFALPNLQGTVPVHAGGSQGPGLQRWVGGQTGGSAAVTLLASQIPSHTHGLMAVAAGATTADPAGASPAQGTLAGSRNGLPFYQSAAPDTAMAAAIGSGGGGQAHPNMMPYFAINFCIATQGIFPPRP